MHRPNFITQRPWFWSSVDLPSSIRCVLILRRWCSPSTHWIKWLFERYFLVGRSAYAHPYLRFMMIQGHRKRKSSTGRKKSSLQGLRSPGLSLLGFQLGFRQPCAIFAPSSSCIFKLLINSQLATSSAHYFKSRFSPLSAISRVIRRSASSRWIRHARWYWCVLYVLR